ncbi:hypothetical protein KUW04_13195 [Halomonas denitrificans]|nr:hypothetical protein [Halomonas denitrificans]
MAKKKSKIQLVLRGHKIGLTDIWPDVQESCTGFNGKVHWSCKSLEEAQRDYAAYLRWESLSPDKATMPLTLQHAKNIVNKFKENPGYGNWAPELAKRLELGLVPYGGAGDEPTKPVKPKPVTAPKPKPKPLPNKVVLEAQCGSAGVDSVILRRKVSPHGAPVNQSITVVDMPSGERMPRKQTHLALALSDLTTRELDGLCGPVEVVMFKGSGLDMMIRYAPSWVANDWQNSQHRPIANLDLVKPAYEPYLTLKDRVTFTVVDASSVDEQTEVEDESIPF